MKVGILGTGAYGLSLALMFNKNNCDIIMWSKFGTEKESLEKERLSSKLPGIKIPKKIKFTTDINEAIKDRDLIVMAVPAKFVDDTVLLMKDSYNPKQHILIATKGIEQDSCLFVDQIITRHLKTKNVAVISGPSFAVDVASNNPIGLALGYKKNNTKNIVFKALAGETLKLRTCSDMRGIEICGAIKNVIAIASGILSGLGYTESTQAFFITESLHDIKNFIKASGGKGKTILTFAGFGDLLLTCTSVKSRNFSFGKLLGSKAPRKEIEEYMKNTTIEGLYTLDSIYKLIKDKNIKLPIIDLIYDIVYNQEDPNNLAKFLIEKE